MTSSFCLKQASTAFEARRAVYLLQSMVVVHVAVHSSMCRDPVKWAAAREDYTLDGLIRLEVAELVHHSALLAQQAKVRTCLALSGWLALTERGLGCMLWAP